MNQSVITDDILVEYILRTLPDEKYTSLAKSIETDALLQQRVTHWENVLFQLNNETDPVAPPPQVWDGIEKRLFPEQQAAAEEKKQGWTRWLVPAFFSLCLMVVTSVYFLSPQPSYAAYVVNDNSNDKLWKIEGNDEHMQFVSLKSVHMKGMDCQAWLKKGDQMIRLGAIPDIGEDASKSLALPAKLAIAPGDEVMIYMVDTGYSGQLPPPNLKMMNAAVLQNI